MAENIILRATSIFAASKSVFTSRNFAFGSGTKTVEIDTVLAWEVDSSKTITDLPLEVGASINDHTYINPTTATVTISESKFGNVIDSINAISNSFREVRKSLIAKDVLSNNLSFYEETKATSKLQDIYEILEDLEITFTLSLPNGQYQNMVLKSISPRGDTTTQGGYNAVLTFKQINIIGEENQLGLVVNAGFKDKVDIDPSGSIVSFINEKLGRS